jgi:hypothetical protein
MGKTTTPPAPVDQKVAATQVLDPVPQPPSPESQQAAIRTVAGPYQFHQRAAHAHDMAARRAAVTIDTLVREIAEKQEEIKRQEKLRRDSEQDARAERDLAHAYGLMLDGVGVARPAVELDVSQPAELDAAQHPATWNGGEVPQTGQFAAQQPDGFCVNCGQHVWRVPVSDASPKGAIHSFGATCDPNAEVPTVADLGEVAS